MRINLKSYIRDILDIFFLFQNKLYPHWINSNRYSNNCKTLLDIIFNELLYFLFFSLPHVFSIKTSIIYLKY